jgi:hypothetical protein
MRNIGRYGHDTRIYEPGHTFYAQGQSQSWYAAIIQTTTHSRLIISSITSHGRSCQKRRIESNGRYRKWKPSSNENSTDLINYIRRGHASRFSGLTRRLTIRPRRRWVSLVQSLPQFLTLMLILLIPLFKPLSQTRWSVESILWRNIMAKLLLRRKKILSYIDPPCLCWCCIESSQQDS